ncbi:hypothetical protein Q7C36_001887 [Tachysurus vachellii]|uniref:Uncharacterized protein n=1 Tax=Tachysurus vachellii TaxID=175792 RepID=A0AA88NV89_TACVA|nr:hypothetical protein Q7C36_001887 [Tachysurus vachellii]
MQLLECSSVVSVEISLMSPCVKHLLVYKLLFLPPTAAILMLTRFQKIKASVAVAMVAVWEVAVETTALAHHSPLLTLSPEHKSEVRRGTNTVGLYVERPLFI